ncbi:DUF4870 domain-containing protein [Spiractinospora alimapuensis]|nr:DUF4870 domain-containing protein [Spiractinospora alimapuensis]
MPDDTGQSGQPDQPGADGPQGEPGQPAPTGPPTGEQPSYGIPPHAASPYGGEQEPPPGQGAVPDVPGYMPAPGYPSHGAPGPYGAAEDTHAHSSQDRTLSMVAHLGGVILSCFGWLPALIVFLVGRSGSPFLRGHATEALNFQITLLIAYIPMWLLYLGLGVFAPAQSPIGSVLIAVVWAVGIVFGILGAIRAARGQLYRYPVAVRIVK